MSTFSHGSKIEDAHPKQITFTDFDGLESFIRDHRGYKKGEDYFCAGFKTDEKGETHRCKENALAVPFLALDCDGFPDAEIYKKLLTFLKCRRGFAYTTSRSKPEAPRARVVLAVNRSITVEEYPVACKKIEREINSQLSGIKFDPSVHRAEQPLFTPLVDADITIFHGKKINVDVLLDESQSKIPEGERNKTMLSIACIFFKKNLSEEEAWGALVAVNDNRCKPPLDERELHAIFKSALKYQSGTPLDLRPTIVIQPGKLPENVDAAEQVLISQVEGVYQRGGVLVSVVTGKSDKYVRRSNAAVTIHPVTITFLVDLLTRAAQFKSAKKNTPIDCPRQVAETLLSRKWWNIPVLNGIVEAPLILQDGRILQTPGYDAETGLLLAIDKQPLDIPEKPTRKDARKALAILKEPLRGFPFLNEAARSVVLAAMLTALVRRVLRSAPGFAFSAPVMGSGKSLVVDVISIVATGREPAKMSQGHDPAEDKKRLMALLMAGDLIVCLDNIERTIDDDGLCTIITERFYQDRVLGSSTMMTVPTNTTILMTGNNLTFSGDITTRVLIASIDPQCERPDEREFPGDLRAEVLAKRRDLLRAALTLLRAYYVAGSPEMPGIIYGRFEDWSKAVRAPLIWAGAADPVLTRDRVADTDPKVKAWRVFLASWFAQYGTTEKMIREVIKDAQPASDGLHKFKTGAAMWDSMIVLAGTGDDVNPRKMGWQLLRIQHRIIGGFRLSRGGTGAVQRWQVSKPITQRAEKTVKTTMDNGSTSEKGEKDVGIVGFAPSVEITKTASRDRKKNIELMEKTNKTNKPTGLEDEPY